MGPDMDSVFNMGLEMDYAITKWVWQWTMQSTNVLVNGLGNQKWVWKWNMQSTHGSVNGLGGQKWMD